MASNKFVLYDLASKPPSTAWSLNPWKSRLLLNFKGLEYTTTWLEYPEIKATLEPHTSANPSTGTWTIPTLKFPDESYLMDSRQIVNRIEKEYPEPSVHLDSPVLTKLEEIMPRLMTALRPIYFLHVPRNILNDASVEYWYTTRAKTAGMPLDQLEKEHGGKLAWDAGQPVLREVEALLKENAEGPLFLGKTVSYADFVWAGFLIFIQRNGGDAFEQLLKISGDAQFHKNLLDAVAPYSARNDH